MKRIRKLISLTILFVFLLPTGVQAAEYLIPGGQIIGIQLENDTLTVAAFDDALGANARSAGLQIGDTLLSLNDHPINSPEDIRSALKRVSGEILLTVRRNGKEKTLTMAPQTSPEGPRLGIYLKQGITGIGTVTWFDPHSGTFGALGHGVNDGKGHLVSMSRGTAFHAEVASIKKGLCGQPGQLKGSTDSFAPWGILLRNTPQGIFGVTQEAISGTPVPTADYTQIRPGSAVIRSAADGRVQEYSVEILKIYPRDRSDGRNFLLKVTDPALLEATGGIVQGMSGSPILQNNAIIGAVTHVLVNDPTMGYGIFIENMLDAAG